MSQYTDTDTRYRYTKIGIKQSPRICIGMGDNTIGICEYWISGIGMIYSIGIAICRAEERARAAVVVIAEQATSLFQTKPFLLLHKL